MVFVWWLLTIFGRGVRKCLMKIDSQDVVAEGYVCKIY